MKIREGFMLRSVAGQQIVVPVGAAAKQFSGMIRLNEMGAFLWERLAAGATRASLLADVLEAYEVEEARAAADIEGFLAQMLEGDFLTDDDGNPLDELKEEDAIEEAPEDDAQ